MAEETIEDVRERWNPGVTTGQVPVGVGTAVEQGRDTLSTDEDALTDYTADGVTMADLRAEIDRRNADRDDDERLSKSGTKDELIARLEEDDEEA